MTLEEMRNVPAEDVPYLHHAVRRARSEVGRRRVGLADMDRRVVRARDDANRLDELRLWCGRRGDLIDAEGERGREEEQVRGRGRYA